MILKIKVLYLRKNSDLFHRTVTMDGLYSSSVDIRAALTKSGVRAQQFDFFPESMSDKLVFHSLKDLEGFKASAWAVRVVNLEL